MSYIVGAEVVNYACTCGLLKPIPQLYFCRHCSLLRCSFCVCHEVDSIFCGKCSENIPSGEARVKKNRCANCFICPSCQQDLSTRIASKGPVNPDDAKSPIKKTYYLSCYFCRWNSRDVGIPDQQSAAGGWPERDNVHAHRLQELMDTYKQIMLSQKQQKENDKKKQRGKFVSYTDRTGVTASALRKRIGLPDLPHAMIKKPKPPEPATARSDVEELPDDLFTEPVNLMEITTIEQRLMQPESQPTTVDKLFPVHKQLLIKRSLRCRQCEHNVSKPEFSPNSVKFKIQHFAYYHIPEVRIVTVEPLRSGKPCELIVKFTNPTQHQTTIAILDLDLAGQESYVEEQRVTGVIECLEQCLSLHERQPMSLPSLSTSTGSQPASLLSLPPRQPSISVKPRKINQVSNCDLEIPESTFLLPRRDDAAEYDDSSDMHSIKDDPKYGIKSIETSGEQVFLKLAYTPKMETIRRKLGNLPVKYQRYGDVTEYEYNILKKYMKKFTFDLTPFDYPTENSSSLESIPTASSTLAQQRRRKNEGGEDQARKKIKILENRILKSPLPPSNLLEINDFDADNFNGQKFSVIEL